MIDTLIGAIEAIMSTEWVYPLVGVLIFLDCFFPFLPSEVPLNLVGTWYGAQGFPHLGTMFVVAIIAAIAGDNLCYALATRLMPLINRAQKGSKTYDGLQWVRRNMRRNAGAAIIIARFIPSARLIMTILLGAMRYPWPLFFFFDSIGVALWAAQALAVGWVGGRLLGGNPALAMLVSLVAAVIVGYAVQRGLNAWMNWRDTRRGFAETP